MYQKQIRHPVSKLLPPLDQEVFEAMYQLFEQIGIFWQNLDNPEQYKSRLYGFMTNRISLDSRYHQYYIMATETIAELIAELGETQAYEFLFTDPTANDVHHSSSPLAVTRQKVSNEFVAFQMALGGFKVFGAKNYLGYIGGANIPEKPAPYRTGRE